MVLSHCALPIPLFCCFRISECKVLSSNTVNLYPYTPRLKPEGPITKRLVQFNIGIRRVTYK